MLKIQVEGQANQVQPFLHDLEHRPHIEFLHQEDQGTVGEMDQSEITVTCFLRHKPNRRMLTVQMMTLEGGEIRIPLLDVVYAEIEEGVKVFAGRSFDVFAG